MAHSMTFLGFVVSSSLHYCVSEKLQSQRDVQRLIYAVEDRALDGRIYTCFRMYTSSSHHMDRFVDQFSCKKLHNELQHEIGDNCYLLGLYF